MRQVGGVGQIIQLGLARVRQHVIAVIAAVPAEIDARLGNGGLTGRRDVLEGQHRVALGRRFIGPGGNHPIAVRVLQLLVDPVLGLLREARRIQFPGGKQQLKILVAKLVAVDRHVVDGVVGAQALLILKRFRECQLWVPEAGILDRLRVARHGVGSDGIARRERTVRDARQAVRLAGKRDLVLDVGRLFRLLAGRHLEPLDNAGEDDEQNECRAEPDNEGSGQRGESGPRGIREEADRDEDHQHRHDPVGGNAGGHIGVADAKDEAPFAQQQFVQVEPVVDREQRGKGRRQHRKMTDGASWEQQVLESGSRRVEACNDEDHQDHDTQEPAPHEAVEGKGKDVEGHILVPDRILDVERLLIEEGQDGLPLARGDLPEQEAEQKDTEQAEDGRRCGHQALPDADRREPPAGVEYQQDVDRANDPEEDSEDEEGPDLRGEARAEDAAVAKCAEPQIVGVERRERLEEEKQEQRDGDGDDPQHSPTGDADGWEARLGRQPAERRFAVEESARRDAPRHGLVRRALGTIRCYPPLPRSAGADCTSPHAPTVMVHPI